MTFKQTPKMKAEGKHYCGGGKVKKYETGGEVTGYMGKRYIGPSVRKQLDDQEKAAKPESDKAQDRFNKAMDEVTKRTQPNMANMNPMGDTYKRGGSVKRKK